MHRYQLLCHDQGIYLNEFFTSDKALRSSSPIILRKFVLRCCKAEFAFLSVWVFFPKYLRFTGQQGSGISFLPLAHASQTFRHWLGHCSTLCQAGG